MRVLERLAVLWIALLITFVIGALAWPVTPWHDLLNNQGYAAWVQAAGSLLALVISIGLWRVDRSREHRRSISAAHIFTSRLVASIKMCSAFAKLNVVDAVLQEGTVLQELQQFGRAIRVDLMDRKVAWEVFNVLALCAECVKVIARIEHVDRDALKHWPEFDEFDRRAEEFAEDFAAATGIAEIVLDVGRQLRSEGDGKRAEEDERFFGPDRV